MELLDWLTWFAFVPVGGGLLIGALLFFWLRHVLLTRTRVWVVTLALTLLLVLVGYGVIFHFAYLLPD